MGNWKKPHPLKKVWSKTEIKFLKQNWSAMNNKEIAKALGIGLTLVRMKCYELGLKRMELEYWTEEQVKFLRDNYKKIGDKELAIIFNSKWKKQKKWTHKHIEKKRRYLKLNRTKKQIKAIHQRNVDRGAFLLCPVKRWLTTGVAKEGEIRMWREQSGRYTPRIKINGKFVHWNRWKWEKHYGPIPKGMNVVFKDNNPQNRTLRNLILITDAEVSRRNSKISSQGLSDNYIAGILSHNNKELRAEIKNNKPLIELKRKQLLLNRTINAKQKDNQQA